MPWFVGVQRRKVSSSNNPTDVLTKASLPGKDICSIHHQFIFSYIANTEIVKKTKHFINAFRIKPVI